MSLLWYRIAARYFIAAFRRWKQYDAERIVKSMEEPYSELMHLKSSIIASSADYGSGGDQASMLLMTEKKMDLIRIHMTKVIGPKVLPLLVIIQR